MTAVRQGGRESTVNRYHLYRFYCGEVLDGCQPRVKRLPSTAVNRYNLYWFYCGKAVDGCRSRSKRVPSTTVNRHILYCYMFFFVERSLTDVGQGSGEGRQSPSTGIFGADFIVEWSLTALGQGPPSECRQPPSTGIYCAGFDMPSSSPPPLMIRLHGRVHGTDRRCDKFSCPRLAIAIGIWKWTLGRWWRRGTNCTTLLREP